MEKNSLWVILIKIYKIFSLPPQKISRSEEWRHITTNSQFENLLGCLSSNGMQFLNKKNYFFKIKICNV